MQSEQRIPTSNPNHRHLIQRQYEEMKEEKAKQMLLLKTMHSEEEAFREVTCQLSFTFLQTEALADPFSQQRLKLQEPREITKLKNNKNEGTADFSITHCLHIYILLQGRGGC
mmetsp:Transcript_21533/g.27873  ORF Transcript_21533/g.27873 Transcript_21533/m.27873 type:complete len:113 (+) Transcript_21533:544-882(+)